jgi:glycine betaine/choline ABC-type transport system substrate-binding protein
LTPLIKTPSVAGKSFSSQAILGPMAYQLITTTSRHVKHSAKSD